MHAQHLAPTLSIEGGVSRFGATTLSSAALSCCLYSYGHRANPEFADLSSRSLRNADGRCHRRIGQPDGGVKPEKVGREYAWQSWPELARLPAAIACLPNSITPLVDHSLTSFFMLPRVAIGARLRLMSTMAQSLTPMEDAMRAKITAALAPATLEIYNDSHMHSHHKAMQGSTSKETHFR